jgi:hypothetical protein
MLRENPFWRNGTRAVVAVGAVPGVRVVSAVNYVILSSIRTWSGPKSDLSTNVQ